MKRRVLVLVPIYRTRLSEHEQLSLARCCRVLRRFPIAFCAPRGLDVGALSGVHDIANVFAFDASYFSNRKSYNRLLLSPHFYKTFTDFDYILICQTDAFVFSDRLEEFCALGYDYIGAPWLFGESIQRYNFPFSVVLNKLVPGINPPRLCHVGNGGFSLRNPAACYGLLQRVNRCERFLSLNEDGFFAWHGSIGGEHFRSAPLDVALDFAFEGNFTLCLERNRGRLPFGCHAWQLPDDDTKKTVMKNFLDVMSPVPENSCRVRNG